MPLQKQPININFAQGLDTKTDPNQLQMGNFLALENSVFTKGKRLTKRNGYGQITVLPEPASFLTTFNSDLTAVGTSIQAYASGTKTWITKGNITPLELSTLPLIRNNLNQTQVDSTIAANGYICTVYTENNGTSNTYKYAIADSATGQNIVAPTVLPTADATKGAPRVFLMGSWFIIVYTATPVSANNLWYIAVPTANPTNPTSPAVITTNYAASTSVAWDGYVFSNTLYIVWNGSSGGMQVAYIQNTFPGSSNPVSATTTLDAAHNATVVSVTADVSTSTLWASYYNSGTSIGYSIAFTPAPIIMALAGYPVEIISSGTILNITSVATAGLLTVFYEVSNTSNGVQTNYVSAVTVTQTTATVGTPYIVLRSVGLASKAFILNNIIYFLAAYSSQYQPTYFLVNASLCTEANPVIVAKLAYENGGGYLPTGLPSVSIIGSDAYIPYLYKDLIEALSSANAANTAVTPGVYSQTGINLVTFDFTSDGLFTSEIGTNLNIAGTGYLIGYDGYSLTENNFHLWPDSVQASITSTSAGNIGADTYFYQVTYEWTDNQGNAFRSAPSIPVGPITTSGSTNTITLIIPTLRITAKVANPVKICVYRYGAVTGNATYYQVGQNGTNPITNPTLNSTTTDSVTFVDTSSSASIIGDNIIYTTGGVLEDTGAPASSAMTLFDDRLWIVDAEDQNLLWFSKQVIESTPVEMSDLLTMYVAPSLGATGPTGPITALSAMDDKLVIFKDKATYYVNGAGPDNTGSNSQYSQPIFITSMVGCSNQRSIVLQPQGLMFEFASEAGNQIWLLGRGLQTQYIGAPVESLTQNATVVSSVAIPGTNQVRFNLSSGITLMYDYYYGQWGTFSTNAISSTLYQGLHTYINPYSQVLQETPGLYVDDATPVLMSFTTAWINPVGLQGYQRAYYFYLLGNYLSPHTLTVGVAYDYSSSIFQTSTINPTNFNPTYGNAPGPYGSGAPYTSANGADASGYPYGGPDNVEQWRVFLQQQRCQAFQITVNENYDPSYGIAAGAGLTLSGLDLVIGVKKGYRPIRAAYSTG
jgi:hypothetical protein